MLSFAFCSLLSGDDDPKRDAAAAPLLDTLTITKVPSQEEAMVVKSPEVPPPLRRVLLLVLPSV
jgi:hypothetical protein